MNKGSEVAPPYREIPLNAIVPSAAFGKPKYPVCNVVDTYAASDVSNVTTASNDVTDAPTRLSSA